VAYTDSLFLLLFGIVWAIAKMLRPWPVLKEWFLIVISCLVIATWGYFDLGLFLFVILLNYGAVTQIMKADPRRSRLLLILFVGVDVATLSLFKYANFIGGSFSMLTGLTLQKFPLGIPLAISFYTFHLISYLIDVHAGKVKVATFREYFFYLSFFPHVIAGPIVRAWQLVPQIGKVRRITTDLPMGLHYLVTGFFLKMVVANNIGRCTDRFWVEGAEVTLSTLDHWALSFLYYCQIYGDFAGYTLMALGMSRLLGYRLPVNFRGPMRAATLQEFWQRWHITLSRWLRDYLYIPLGGNRVSRLQMARNVIVTMLLGGLWHGAGWHFVAWGGMHGFGIVAEQLLGLRRLAAKNSINCFFCLILTQVWVVLAWVFFRAPNSATACSFIWHMIPFMGYEQLASHRLIMIPILCSIPIIIHNFAPLLLKCFPRRNLGSALGTITAILLILNFIVFSPNTVFIYFKF